VRDLICTSDADSVVQLGDDSAVTQGTVAKVPQAITLENVSSRPIAASVGSRCMRRNVALFDCQALDVFWPGVKGGGVDSQGLWVFNTPGEIYVAAGATRAARSAS
jgi:hypothetical protein